VQKKVASAQNTIDKREGRPLGQRARARWEQRHHEANTFSPPTSRSTLDPEMRPTPNTPSTNSMHQFYALVMIIYVSISNGEETMTKMARRLSSCFESL